jgi:hypothetical protein
MQESVVPPAGEYDHGLTAWWMMIVVLRIDVAASWEPNDIPLGYRNWVTRCSALQADATVQ